MAYGGAWAPLRSGIRDARYGASIALLFFAGATGGLWAQTAQINGRISDPSGASIVGAHLAVTNADTGVKRSVESNADGLYVAPLLAPGPYVVRIEKQGFEAMIREDIQLDVGRLLTLDLVLKVGAMTQTIEVTGTAPLLEGETSSMGEVVQGRQVAELPLLGRNPYALGGLVPGVRTATGVNDLPVDMVSTAGISINGVRGDQNEYLLDGAPNTNAWNNGPLLRPSVDSVQEFKVQTNAYSAEYGRAAGGVFNLVTRSGTNELHFSAYEFLRNNALNANDWFANQAGKAIAPFRFNQFGATVGGPVVLPHIYNGRNRTFFFVNTELVRFTQGVTFTGTVPTAAERAGDFSQTRNAAGQLLTLYDPAATRPGASGAFVRDPFSGNIVPPNRIDPVARKISSYWPLPNAAGSNFTHINNFVNTDANNIQKNTWNAKFDESVNDGNRFFGRVSRDESPLTRALPYGRGYVASPTTGPQTFTYINAAGEGTHIFSSTLIGVLRGSFARMTNSREPASYGFDITQLGLPASLKQQLTGPPAFPVINVTGYTVSSSVTNTVIPSSSLGSMGVFVFNNDQFSLQGQLIKTFNRHNVKAGLEARIIRYNPYLFDNNTRDQFNFASNYTQGPNPVQPSAQSGYAFATFLLGVPTGSISTAPALALQTRYYSGYLQDDWKITNKLTMNVGLRYELELPRTERFNQLTNFDYGATPPINVPSLNLRGALSFAGVNGVSRYQANPDYNNLAPRLGLAYRIDNRTAIRAGAGIFFAATTGVSGGASSYGTSGFLATTSIVTSLDGVTPIVSFSNPFPNGVNQPSGSRLGAATLLGQPVSFDNRGNAVPYTAQWNLGIQRELPKSLLLDIAYVGTRGLKFPLTEQLNQLPDSALGLKNGLLQQVPNPFYGQIGVGILASSTVAKSQLLRPFPQFDGVSSVTANIANSAYHALQVKFEKRYSRGMTLRAAYAYSKMMDLSTGNFSGETLGGGSIQNWNNLPAEWAVSSVDQTHRLTLDAVYELPFLKAKRGVTGRVLGGWELGLIGSFYSGGPLGITSAVNNTFSQGGGQRPNWSGQSAELADPTPQRWFDTSQFSAPPAFTFGNAGRTFSGLRDAGARNIDLSLVKSTVIQERLRLQLRAEAFNLVNTPRFGPPNVSFGSQAFGVVSSQANQSRILQFAMKLLF